MTIAEKLKNSTVKTLLIGLCALGVAGQAEAGHHHHKESKGRQAAGIIHAVGDVIRAVTGQPDVVVTPGVVTPAPVMVAPTPIVTPAPVMVAPAPVIAPAPAIVNSYVPLLPSVTGPIGHGPIVRPARVLVGPGHGGCGSVTVPAPRLPRENHR